MPTDTQLSQQQMDAVVIQASGPPAGRWPTAPSRSLSRARARYWSRCTPRR